jgi:8-oxo-dGTP pyrophosphatase MutT (NUDIX family)
MIHKTNHASVDVSQALVLQRGDGKILLLEDFKGRWNLPGGRLENNEAWLAGLQREIREETSIVSFELRGVLNVYLRVSGSSGRQTYGVVFNGTTQETTVILSEEHRSYRWVASIDECEDLEFRLAEFKCAVRAVFTGDAMSALI